MTDDPPPPPTRSDDAGPPLGLAGCLKPFSLLTGLVAAGLLLATGLVMGRCASEPQAAPAPSTTVIQRGPNVIVAIRDLAQLEGASFHMERVIDLKEKQSRFSGLIEAEDAILLVAAGDVTAGVDLSRLEPGDVQIDSTQMVAKITLPAATILSARVDNEHTYVHTRSTDLLAKRQEALETRARQEAERTLRTSAIEAKLLGRAEANVARTIESLVRSLGYREVEVSFKKPKLE